MRRCLLFAVAVLLAVWVSPLDAKPSKEQISAARALAYAGYELLQQEQWAEAYDRFQQAEKIFHAPPHVLFMARAKRGLGEYVEARDLYQSLANEQLAEDAPQEFHKAQQDAQQELEGVLPKIGSLQITLAGPSLAQATVTIDGADVSEAARSGPVDVDPGEHTVRAAADGYQPAETQVTVEEGAQAVPVALTLAVLPEPEPPVGASPLPPPEEPGSLVPGFVVMGAGVAIVAAGIVTGALAMGKADELEESCPVRTACPPENEALEEDARLFGTVSTVGFVVGGAALAGGAVLLWLRPGGSSGADQAETAAAWTVAPVVGPGVLGIRGTF